MVSTYALTQSRSPRVSALPQIRSPLVFLFPVRGFPRINLRERHERNSREGWFAVLARPDAYSIDSPGLCRRLRDGMVDDFARERLSEEMGDCGVPGKSGDVDSGSATLLLPLGGERVLADGVYLFASGGNRGRWIGVFLAARKTAADQHKGASELDPRSNGPCGDFRVNVAGGPWVCALHSL